MGHREPDDTRVRPDLHQWSLVNANSRNAADFPGELALAAESLAYCEATQPFATNHHVKAAFLGHDRRNEVWERPIYTPLLTDWKNLSSIRRSMEGWEPGNFSSSSQTP